MTWVPRTDAEPLSPGAAHPHPPLPPADLAALLRVDAARVAAWCDAGLPQGAEGIDPVAAAAWLVDGRLQECPVLARRWRAWFAWFAPVVRGEDASRRLRLRRRCALHLPGAGSGLRWILPRLGDGHGQRRLAERHPAGVAVARDGLVVERERVDGALELVLGEDVAVDWRPAPAPPELLALVEELAAGFRYGYRHHARGEPPRREGGSCLDCALALGARLDAIGRPWRLVGGVVARSAVAGLHAWLEVEAAGGAWLPVDPTMAAVARQLGGPGIAWRDWARTWTGSGDARRVAIARAEPARWAEAIGGAELTVGGRRRDAWACIDLACGDCRWSFAALSR